MKIRCILFSLLAATFIAYAPFNANAQDKTCGGKGMGQQCQMTDKHPNIPDLTPEQQKQMEGLHSAFMKEQLTLKNQIAEKKAHIKTLSTVDEPNQVEINKTIDEMYVIKADLEKKKAAHIQAVRKILTPEQRLIFDMKHGGGADGNCHKGGGQGCNKQGQACQMQGQGCHNQGQCCKMQGQGSGCQQQKTDGCQHEGGMGNGQGCQHQQSKPEQK